MNEIPYLVLGVLGGGVATWLIMRGKIALAGQQGRSAGDVERASLSEKLNSATMELTTASSRWTAGEERLEALRLELATQGREIAQLTERADRLAVVERERKGFQDEAERLKAELSSCREANGSLNADKVSKEKRINELLADHQRLSASLDEVQDDRAAKAATIAELTTTLEAERNQTKKDLAALNEAREQMTNQFKALAADILEEKTKKFTEQNKTNLAQLLDPFKEKITAFQAKVEEVYVNEGKERTKLGEHIKQLTELNNTLSKDAQNLTLALKGDRKAQGNWGEIMLDRALEMAGLVEGTHYDRQGGMKNEEGRTQVLDVVIHLPGDRHIVVDSKMTLPDYRAFSSSDSEEECAAALKRHIASIRAHMNGLSGKNYQALYGLSSLDCVVMFIPLEPAFMLAVTHDSELLHDAWSKNVMLVSPTTLLFVIRAVANFWRQEDLSRNAQEISKRGAELYEKLASFVADLQKVGERLNQAQDSYNEARKRLSEGRGNVIRQAEMLKDLGVKPSKSLPSQWIDSTPDDPVKALPRSAAANDSAAATTEPSTS